MDLETFRKELQKIPDRLKRDVCIYNIALRYGMVQENREPIKFYFERVGGTDETTEQTNKSTERNYIKQQPGTGSLDGNIREPGHIRNY